MAHALGLLVDFFFPLALLLAGVAIYAVYHLARRLAGEDEDLQSWG